MCASSWSRARSRWCRRTPLPSSWPSSRRRRSAAVCFRGSSEPPSRAAPDPLCDLVFGLCGGRDVMGGVMPAERPAIHLDMIFTQLDRELCCVSPPHFVGPERLAVLHRRKKSKGVKEVPNFFAAMQAVDQPLEPIFCGGNNRTLQEREQWASAC